MDDLILWAQMDALEQNLASVEKILMSEEIKERFEAISGLLQRRIAGRKRLVEKIREDLETILKDAGKDEKEKEKALTTAWKKFADVRGKSREVFRECHDFLSGIAVRDKHKELDERIDAICWVADELLTQYAKALDVKWDSVTLILGEESLSASLARIIRLRFPEWDVWNLPFVFHEFGHVVASETSDFKDFLGEQGLDAQKRAHLNELFADAFATYMLGPAYACASILLRFDPGTAYEEEECCASYAKRVYFILETLKRMDASLAGSGPLGRRRGGPYKEIIDVLENAWDSALKRAQPSDGFTEEDKDLLNRWFADIYDILDSEVLVVYARWPTAEVLSEKLLEGKLPSEILTGAEKLIDVLNAAWHCRLYEASPDKVNEISRRAAELCKEIIEPGEKRVPEKRRQLF